MTHIAAEQYVDMRQAPSGAATRTGLRVTHGRGGQDPDTTASSAAQAGGVSKQTNRPVIG